MPRATHHSDNDSDEIQDKINAEIKKIYNLPGVVKDSIKIINVDTVFMPSETIFGNSFTSIIQTIAHISYNVEE